MNDLQQEKAILVKSYLNPAFKFMRPDDFRTARYVQNGHSERVDVFYRDGCMKAVDVTGLSLEETANIVLVRAFLGRAHY